MLLVSVAWKIAIRLGTETEPKDRLIVDFLKRNHFDVSPTEQIADDFSDSSANSFVPSTNCSTCPQWIESGSFQISCSWSGPRIRGFSR